MVWPVMSSVLGRPANKPAPSFSRNRKLCCVVDLAALGGKLYGSGGCIPRTVKGGSEPMAERPTRAPMTQKGKQRLMDELRRLRSVERPKIVKEIEEARDHGDLSENAEFHAAKEKQSLLEGQMRDIDDTLARAEVIDVSKLSGNKVVFGATVTLADGDSGEEVVYQIVGDREAEPKNGKISVSSPIARSLIGKSVGDEVQVRIPTGVRTFEILNLDFKA